MFFVFRQSKRPPQYPSHLEHLDYLEHWTPKECSISTNCSTETISRIFDSTSGYDLRMTSGMRLTLRSPGPIRNRIIADNAHPNQQLLCDLSIDTWSRLSFQSYHYNILSTITDCFDQTFYSREYTASNQLIKTFI